MKLCRSRTDCGSQTEPQQAGMALSLWKKSLSIYISAQTKLSKGADPAFRSTSVDVRGSLDVQHLTACIIKMTDLFVKQSVFLKDLQLIIWIFLKEDCLNVCLSKSRPSQIVNTNC
ncbi:hypothetical protein U1Q18_044732 [Sarracenia purpurea var. burkii]